VGTRSGVVRVYGKRNKYREVPLNSTARDALRAYLATLPPDTPCLFPSRKGTFARRAARLGRAHR
jgi:integrase/recombinase XerD